MNMETRSRKILVGVTRDFVSPDGNVDFVRDMWEKLQKHPRIELEIMAESAPTNISVDHTKRFDTIMMKRSPLHTDALVPGSCRLKLVSRNGVGYDHINIEACTEAGVMVAITPEAVRMPVASANVALILALAHRMFERDRRTRNADWDKRWSNKGIELQGRTLGVIGLGNIGKEIFRLMKPWNMVHLGVAPNHTEAEFSDLNVKLVDLGTLLSEADFLCLCCPLTEKTHQMIGERELRSMKNEAYLINTARGEIIDETKLARALEEEWIAGAGIDVFEQEPPSPNNPLLGLNNVIFGSHNLGITEEMNQRANHGAATAVLALADEKVPEHLVNPEVLDHPRLRYLIDK